MSERMAREGISPGGALVRGCWRCWQRWRGWVRELARARRPRPRLLSIAERLDLGGRKSLLLIACGEHRFLVGSGAETISAIHQIATPHKGLRRGSGLKKRLVKGTGKRSAIGRRRLGAALPEPRMKMRALRGARCE